LAPSRHVPSKASGRVVDPRAQGESSGLHLLCHSHDFVTGPPRNARHVSRRAPLAHLHMHLMQMMHRHHGQHAACKARGSDARRHGLGMPICRSVYSALAHTSRSVDMMECVALRCALQRYPLFLSSSSSSSSSFLPLFSLSLSLSLYFDQNLAEHRQW
jgi:hypothetical protein